MIPAARAPVLFASVVLALLLFGACASPSSSGEIIRRAGDGDQVTLTIENRSFNDATIYAHWRAASRVRVGRVTGNTTETFELEWRGGEMSVEADFLAADEYLSEPISVARGDHLRLVLQP